MDVNDPRLLDADASTGITEFFIYNDKDDSFQIETRQDVEPLIELSKSMYNNAPLRWGEFTHVKHIPAVLAMELAKQGIMSAGYKILDEARFRKFLNDRDTSYFRTRPGKI